MRVPTLLFLAVLLFYAITLQPSLAWGDGIRLQREVITAESFILAEMVDVPFAPDPFPFARLGVAAWDHPLYVIVGHTLLQLLPAIAPLWLVNFVSALFGAGTVALFYLWCRRHTGSTVASLFAALALAVSHTFWWHAVTPEVYTLFAFLLLIAILLYDQYLQTARPHFLYGAALALGLGAANHLLAFLAIPAALLYHLAAPEWRQEGRLPAAIGRAFSGLFARRWLFAGVAFLVGFSPYLIQFLRLLRTFPLGEVMGPAIGATFLRGSLALAPAQLLASIGAYLTFLVYQFNPVGLLLGVYGWWVGRRRYPQFWWQALSLYAVYALFGLVYQVSDQFAFFLGAHVFWAAAMSMGVTRLFESLPPGRQRLAIAGLAVSLAVMPLLYATAPALLRAGGVTETGFGIPQIGTGVRDGLDYYLNPNRRGDTAAYEFGRETLAALPPEALVLAEWYADTDEYFVLRYFVVVEGLRPDVEVVGWPTVDPFSFDPALALNKVEEAIGRQPVYLASVDDDFYAASILADRYCIVPEYHLYRIYPSDSAVGGAACLDPHAAVQLP